MFFSSKFRYSEIEWYKLYEKAVYLKGFVFFFEYPIQFLWSTVTPGVHFID